MQGVLVFDDIGVFELLEDADFFVDFLFGNHGPLEFLDGDYFVGEGVLA